MGEIVDVRPDRFLREMREHGTVDKACEASGMAKAELESLCRADRKFDLTQVEVFLEFMEDTMMAEVHKRLGHIRTSEMQALAARHG